MLALAIRRALFIQATVVAVLIAVAFGRAPAAVRAGVQLPETLEVRRETLSLVSCGVRDTLWIAHYVAGLYLPPGAPVSSAGDPAQPAALRLTIVDDRFLPDRIPAKWRRVLERELEHEALSPSSERSADSLRAMS